MNAQKASDDALLYVVIPYYAGHAHIEALLASLAASTRPPDGVILVDNSPEPESFDRKCAHIPLHPQRVLLRTAPGIGFGRANNAGAMFAVAKGATHICLVNQDATVAPKMLAELLHHHEAQGASISGPIQLDPTTGQLTRFVANHYVAEARAGRKLLPVEDLPATPRTEPRYLSGACLFFHVDLLTRHGLFDPLYTMYGEDRDLSERLVAAGESQLLVRSAHFYHHHANATARGEERARRIVWQAESGAVNYLKRRWGAQERWRFRLEQAVLYFRVGTLLGHANGRIATQQRVSSLLSKSRDLSKARRGESVRERMLRYVERDLGAQALLYP